MFKRLTWMTFGAAAGAAGTVWTQRKVKAQADRFTPPALAEQAKLRVSGVRDHLGAALADGRATMQATESQMRRQVEERTAGRSSPRTRPSTR